MSLSYIGFVLYGMITLHYNFIELADFNSLLAISININKQ